MRRGSKVAAAAAGVVLVWTGVSCLRAGVFHPPDRLPRHARHAMVLDGQGPSGSRAFEGLDLLRRGTVDTLVLSGVRIGGGFVYSMIWSRMLPLTGSERTRVQELRSDCSSTQDEAMLSDSIFHALGEDTVVVVTSRYHAWRASSIFRLRARFGTVFAIHAAVDPSWDKGWSDREASKMRFLEWTKRLAWVLVEQWMPHQGRSTWCEVVRGERLGQVPAPAWTP
jgi:hypothetical protein